VAVTGKPLYNEDFGINDIVQPSNSKMHGHEPRYNEPPLKREHFVSSLGLCYIGFHCLITFS